MRLPWSISTTVRNPERLRSFLKILKKLEGKIWNNETQVKFQVLLIQYKVYGFGSQQFYKDLTSAQVKLMDNPEPITFEQAKGIFVKKKYVDPAMRGRQSLNPLEKLGLVALKHNKINITSLGEYLLREDYDLGEMFFRSFIKWQIPNLSSSDYKASEGYNIKPFIGTLHLIAKVNHGWEKLGKSPVGISKEEFSLFAPTLINCRDIGKQAQRIFDLRLACEGKSTQDQKQIKEEFKNKFAKEFLKSKSKEEIKKLLSNLKDYGDNAIRYFRLTRYLYVRGGGFFIDLEPRRQIEINNLLKHDNAESLDFPNEEAYLDYLADINQPELPWEKEPELTRIIETTLQDIQQFREELRNKGIKITPFTSKDYSEFNKDRLKEYIEELRIHRRGLNDIKIRYESQEIGEIEGYIKALKEIYKSDRKPVELERLVTLALNALNDALNIKPNYPVGDDNEPTFTAPANKADIECFYDNFNSVCEVTMLTDKSQWYYEGQPVMRHVRDFEKQHLGKEVFCVFVAPRLHRDTVNTFWTATRYEYEGVRQKIIPLTIGQLIELLEILLQIKKKGRQFKHTDLLELYSKIAELPVIIKQSDLWLAKIPETINRWKEEYLLVK
ncbi:MAG: AlwI family type II restriction endonuclease [Elusimicrobia bacterium]|nr:AlwI family type II restriction endonuclease [Elusimicrobiota bacterium]